MDETKRRAPSIDDFIGEDGLLSKIVSKIPLEEAVRTSVLSKRWKYIWTYVPNLYVSGPVIDYITVLMRCGNNGEMKALLEAKTDKAVAGMDVLLNQHCGSLVETFKVDLLFYEKHAGSLDRWVAFAAAANTKELVMKFQTRVGCLLSEEIYEFPFHLLFQQKQQSSFEHLHFQSCSLHVPPGIGCLSLLQTLELHLVSMGDVDFQNLVTTCSVMERLVVERCTGLVDMRIHQQSGQLKHLTVERCFSLKSIDVRGARLVTLSYGGEEIEFSFDDASCVKELLILFSYFAYFLTLPNVVPHCEKLTLRLDNGTTFYELMDAPEMIYPRFEHLKHLEVTVDIVMGDNLPWLVPLLAAAPFLEKFSLSLDVEELYMPEEVQVRNFPLAHLEEVEIDRFTGSRRQQRVLEYLLNNASSLKSMKIIGSSCRYTEKGCEEILPSELEKIRDYLKRIASPCLNLSIR